MPRADNIVLEPYHDVQPLHLYKDQPVQSCSSC